jgi:hypothetical protein
MSKQFAGLDQNIAGTGCQCLTVSLILSRELVQEPEGCQESHQPFDRLSLHSSKSSDSNRQKSKASLKVPRRSFADTSQFGLDLCNIFPELLEECLVTARSAPGIYFARAVVPAEQLTKTRQRPRRFLPEDQNFIDGELRNPGKMGNPRCIPPVDLSIAQALLVKETDDRKFGVRKYRSVTVSGPARRDPTLPNGMSYERFQCH